MTPDTPAQSNERMVDVGRGIELCVRTHGDSSGPPLLLVHGLGMQLVGWPDALIEDLVGRGFHVVRFDNRDIGRSTGLRVPVPTPRQLVRRRGFDNRQYTLADMATDTAGLIHALGLPPVHVVGVSMGGMIAQTLAAQDPAKVQSLVSIMSTTGYGRVGQPARSTLLRMARPPSRSRSASTKRTVGLFKHIGSRGFPFDEAAVRAGAELAFDRAHDPAGPARQIAAIMKSGNRTAQVRTITAPTLVIHGDRDLMVAPSGGHNTAEVIPGARLESIVGMGHDLPAAVLPRIASLIAEHATENREVAP